MQPRIHLSSLETLKAAFPDEAEIWAVDLDRQRCFRLSARGPLVSTPVSTSRYGVSDEPDSCQTPPGAHRVCEVIGTGAPVGQPFRSRKPRGTPLTCFTGGEGDAILTRILWLDGLVPGLNTHSKARYIYIHGTHQEEKLGSPASSGCIRMGNQVLADWCDSLENIRPLVWIGHLHTP